MKKSTNKVTKATKVTKVPRNQLFPRELGVNGWAYRDREQHIFALKAQIFGFDLLGFDDFLEKEKSTTSVSRANQRWFIARRSQALEAARANDRQLLRSILETLHIARQFVQSDEVTVPLAQLGSRFKRGRKQGTRGPLRIAVENLVKKDPKISADNAWQKLQESAPAQMEFTGSRPEFREVWLKDKRLSEWPYFKKLLSRAKSELKQ